MEKGFFELEVSKLLEVKWNYKQENLEKLEKLKQNIKRNGFLENIIVRELEDGRFEVVNGNHRLKALKDLGIRKVMVYNLGKIPIEAAKKIAIETNEIKFDIDTEKLEKLITELLETYDYEQLLADLPVEIDDFISDALKKEVEETDFSAEEEETIEETIYTTKINTPQYIPKGEKPEISELFDDKKAKELLQKIEQSNLPAEMKTFLRYAAFRFVKFNFKNIAEFYAHADKQIQEFFEDLALVIIDFDDAIHKGFVQLTKEIIKFMKNDTE